MIEFLAASRAPRVSFRHLGELAILGALFALWIWARPFPLTEPLGFATMLFGMLLLARIFPSPGRFQFAAFCWLFVIPAGLYARNVALYRQIIGLEEGPNPLRPPGQIWVPYLALGWRDFLAMALSFLLGVSTARPRFSLARFACAYAIGAAAIGAALYGPLMIQNVPLGDGHFDLYEFHSEEIIWGQLYGSSRGLWGGLAFGLLFSVVALSLKEVRQSLESALAVSLKSGEPSPPKPERLAPRGMAHANLILLLFAAGAWMVYGHYERKMIASLQGGSERWPAAPAGAINAIEELSPSFAEREAPKLDIQASAGVTFEARRSKYVHQLKLPMPYDFRMLANWKTSAKAADAAAALIDREAFRLLWVELDPCLRAIDSLREADGAWRWNGFQMARIQGTKVLLVGRLIAVRGIVAIAAGRDEDALREIERVYNIAWAIQDRSDLIGSIIGQHLRICGTNVAYNYYLHHRADAEASDKLEKFLRRMRPRARLLIDPKMLERTGPAFWPVTPAYERTMPIIVRRREQILGATAEFDRLLIALALERFKRDRGEYPRSLVELAPVYFDAEPLDPVDGKPFIYEPRGDGFVLDYADLVAARKSGPSPRTQAPPYQEDCANPSLESEIKAAAAPPPAPPQAEGAPQP